MADKEIRKISNHPFLGAKEKMADKEIRIVINGRVQGVNFRWLVKGFCDENNIRGYVLNREDGSVEIMALGEEEKLNRLIIWIKGNPGFTRIDEINVSDVKEKVKYASFKISREENYIIDKAKGIVNLGKKLI